jgi:hypothetical protein
MALINEAELNDLVDDGEALVDAGVRLTRGR